MEKNHILYLVRDQRGVLHDDFAHTKRNPYWASLSNIINERQPSTQEKTRSLLLQTLLRQNYSRA